MTANESWTCPDCGRRFARRGQGHVCAEAVTLDAYFATALPHERHVFDAVHGFLSTLGPVHVEPVGVGIFLKKPGQVAQLRPATKWVDLTFSISRPVRHRLIVRKPVPHGRFHYHAVRLTGPEDLDDEILGWLTEAYLAAAD